MEQSVDFEKTATKVSLVSVAGNTVLSLLKLLAGILAHSGAMISDAVHSASDVFSSSLSSSGSSSPSRPPIRSTLTGMSALNVWRPSSWPWCWP